MKIQIAKIAAGLMLGTVLFPSVSFAQTATITAAEVNALETAITNWQANPDGPTNPQIASMCNDLGAKIYTITSGKYSTAIVGTATTYDCATAKVVPDSTKGTDALGVAFNRPYEITVSTVPLQNFIISLRQIVGAPEISKDSYEEAQKQAAESNLSQDTYDSVSSFLGWIVKALSSIIISVLSFLASTALYLMYQVAQFAANTQQNLPDIVSQGWTMVRDFMNIFFILSLIIMAIATILRFDAYNYKQLIARLVFMALLINFSQIIAVTLVSFSDTIMMMFKPEAGLWETNKVVLKSFLAGGDSWVTYLTAGKPFEESLGSAVSSVIGLTMMAIAFSAVALLLFVRLIGLWFLIMISPVAYALYVLPNTQQYAKMWWSTFIKYLIWGPVAMFFFQIGWIMMVNNGRGWVESNVLNNLFIAAFFWAGFMVAKRSGVYGAEMITSSAQKYGKAFTTTGTKAWGSYWWRGSAPGHAAWLAGRLGGKERADRWNASVKGAVGRTTAQIQNVPGNFQQKYIKNPQADRDKVVNKERRRTQIRKGYFSLDDDAAKKLKPADVAYAIEQGKGDEDFYRSILEHGTNESKLTVARAYADGLIKANDKFKQSQYEQVWDDYRQAMWKMSGGKQDDPRAKTYLQFVVDPNTGVKTVDSKAVYKDALNIKGKKPEFDPNHVDYKANAQFSERVGNAYTRIKPVERVKKTKSSTASTSQNTVAARVAPPPIPPSTSPNGGQWNPGASTMNSQNSGSTTNNSSGQWNPNPNARNNNPPDGSTPNNPTP